MGNSIRGSFTVSIQSVQMFSGTSCNAYLFLLKRDYKGPSEVPKQLLTEFSCNTLPKHVSILYCVKMFF